MELFNELAMYFGPDGSTRRVVMLGCVLLGMSSGVLGTFALLRRQSLLGDAMAHSALPGVCLAFLLTGTKHPLFFLLGAMASGLLGAWIVSLITTHSRIKNDTAIGLVLSVFFGFGVVLLTYIQKSGAGNQSGLDTFLFGKAAFLLYSDIYVLGGMCALLVLLVWFFFKEFKLLSFDPGFGASVGLPMKALDLFLTSLVVISVMIGLQVVGVILMAALLIIPAAAARQWTDKLERMCLIAAGVGAFSGVLGAFCSAVLPKMPTGPVMVLAASSIFLTSLFFAPKRGLVFTWWKQRQNRIRITRENILKCLYKLLEPAHDWERFVSPSEVCPYLSMTSQVLEGRCDQLAEDGLLRKQSGDTLQYALTEAGLKEAKRVVRNHRLWELYLTHRVELASDHVHRDAEEMEHILPPELIAQLEAMFDESEHDPHGKPIPKLHPKSP